ncbi:hypothetical protein WJX84_007739 [Apatococcus fuscideae]|uniref:UBA domain-containing protein n=1 Tax=Apatococcus fuscideae TaxID=2026836 RepID=A0AAW1TAA2_9CHLO
MGAAALTAVDFAGPYVYIFASLVEYTLNVPPAQRFELFGWRLTDKAFVYLASLQLLWSSPRASIPACLTGLLFGAAYWVAPLGLQQFKIPAVAARWLQGASRAPSRLGQPAQVPHRPAFPQQQSSSQPTQLPAASAPRLPEASPAALEQMAAMGFDRSTAAQALQQNNNDVAAALAFLV